MKHSIKLRAHHGMCLSFFEGKGYSDDFTKHMQQVLEDMEENPMLQVGDSSDIICSRCPNLKNGVCVSAEKVASYDRKVLEQCGLARNEELSWNAFTALVKERILSVGKRAEICKDCQWSAICSQKESFYQNKASGEPACAPRQGVSPRIKV